MEPTGKAKTKPTVILCGCGMDNTLVCVGGVWKFDIQKHGNGEPFRGQCFNCSAALKGPKGWTAPPVKASKAAGVTEADKQVMLGLVAQNEAIERRMAKLAGDFEKLTKENQDLRANAQGGGDQGGDGKNKKSRS